MLRLKGTLIYTHTVSTNKEGCTGSQERKQTHIISATPTPQKNSSFASLLGLANFPALVQQSDSPVPAEKRQQDPVPPQSRHHFAASTLSSSYSDTGLLAASDARTTGPRDC